MVKKEVKDSKSTNKIVKQSNFYLAIFNRIKEGKSPADISKTYRISKQRLNHYIKNLKEWGFIAKHSKSNWHILVKEFSLGTRPTTNLHALQINIPILSGEIKGLDWEIKEELKNWTPKYKTLDILGGITIKNNNNKSISLFIHTRDIADLKDIDTLCFEVRNWALEFFKREFNVTLDLFRAEVKSLHIATQDKNAELMREKGEKFELDLDKAAEKVFPTDKIKAKAWIDGSPYAFTAETNDKEWKRAYLSMPFAILHLMNSLPALEEYNRNLKLHIEVQEEQLRTLQKIQETLAK